MAKKKTTKKKFNFPKIIWNTRKDESSFERPTINTTEVLINGKLVTSLILSLVSAFIDIVFFSGLSKSGYPFFGWYVPAAIILSIMSIGFSSGKFFVAMQLAAIKEIQSRMLTLGYEVHKRFRWLKIKWHSIHKFLIAISVITSISLSVITIGNGVRNMEQNIKSQTADAQYLIDLKSSINEGNTDKRSATKSNISGTITAQETAKAEVERYFNRLVQYQEQYFKIQDSDLSDEEKKTQGDAIIQKIVKEIPGATARNAIYFSKADLQKSIQKTATSNETIDTSSLYDEQIAYDEASLNEFILALKDKEYRTPDGTLLQFVNEDGTPVNREVAISRLQHSIMEWQSDTGDAGASSKVFTLIATYLNADETAGGLGVSEVIMMILIMIFGIVQEFLIAAFTPRATVNRKMLSQFNEYLYGVDVNRFMLETYKDYYNWGLLTTEAFEAKCEKAVHLMGNSVEDIIKKYSVEKKDELLELETAIAKREEVACQLQDENTSLKSQLTILNDQFNAAKETWSEQEKDWEEKLRLSNEAIDAIRKDRDAFMKDALAAEKEIKEKKVEEPKRKIVGYSSAVDDAVKEIEDLI